MKKIALIIFSSLILLSNSISQDDDKTKVDKQNVTQKEFVDYKASINDSIKQIGKRVDNAAETLKIAKEYSKSADGLVSLFFTIFGTLLAVLGGGLIVLYFRTTSRYKKTLKNQYKNYKEKVDRLINNEVNTLKIKKNAKLLFLYKKNENVEKNIEFNALQNTIFKEFPNENITKSYTNDISMISDSNYTGFLSNESELKVLIMNDDLFNGLTDDNGFVDDGESNKKVKNFLKSLEESKVGLTLFGKTRLHEFEHSYKAYANEPYSVYANLNNLLKYMFVAKKVKL